MKTITEYLINNHVTDEIGNISKLNLGDKCKYDNKECLVVYQENGETWLLSDYICTYKANGEVGTIITCYKDERNAYNKNGWAIPGVSEMIKINDNYLSKLSKDKFFQLFTKSIWVNNDRSGRAMKYNYTQRKTIYPENYTSAGIRLLKKLK